MAKQVNDIVDLDLSVIRKKRFRIDGDNNRILELNTSDLNILVRLKDAYPKLLAFTEDVMKEWPDEIENSDNLDSEVVDTAISILKKIDTEMRELVDYIFDSNVSEVCAPTGSMYDPVNGGFRFEHIINCLSSLYETDITSEVNKISKRVQRHTDKYIKK